MFPSEYPSLLAISTPFNLPDTKVLIPLAPAFIAFLIAFFSATLNGALFSICVAIYWISVSFSSLNLKSLRKSGIELFLFRIKQSEIEQFLFDNSEIQSSNFLSDNSFYLEVNPTILSGETIISYIFSKYPSTFSCEKIQISSYADTKIDNASDIDRRNVVSITATKYYDQTPYTVCNSLTGSFSYNSAVSKFDEVNSEFVSQKGLNIVSYNNNVFNNLE